MSTRARRMNQAPAVLGAAALVLGLITGCAPTTQEINPSTSAAFQSSVLEVTRAAASGEVANAIAKLDALQAQLREATAKGVLTGDRAMRIQAAIDLVRADLAAALPPPTPTPTPTVTVTRAPAKTQTPTQTQTPGPGNGDNGNGNGKGKGKGNDKNDD